MSLNRQLYLLPEKLDTLVQATIADWKKNDNVRRLWQRDASLWSASDESNWLGWRTFSFSAWAAPACAPKSSA